MAVLHQINQQIEDLRLDRDQFGATPEFASVDVKQMIAKEKFQNPLLPRRSGQDVLARNYQALLNHKSTCSQSLPAEPEVCSAVDRDDCRREVRASLQREIDAPALKGEDDEAYRGNTRNDWVIRCCRSDGDGAS